MTQINIKDPTAYGRPVFPISGLENDDGGTYLGRLASSIQSMFNEIYGNMGTATVNFGSFPGSSDASVTIAQPKVTSSAVLDAWILPTDTVDHPADEHSIIALQTSAGQIVPGVGFTVNFQTRDGGLEYGQWTFAWSWLSKA